MQDNPYAAPRSVVADVVDPLAKRPRSVDVALLLLALMIARSAWQWIGDLMHIIDGERSVLAVVWGAVKMGVAILLCVQIARGRNWARQAQRVFIVLGFGLFAFYLWTVLFQMPPGIKFTADPLRLGVELSSSVAGFVALYLLFIPGADWFKRRSSSWLP